MVEKRKRLKDVLITYHKKKRVIKYIYKQDEIISNPDHAFLISSNTYITKLINSSSLKIGDIASCVTGFYSGDDKTYLACIDTKQRNSKHYRVIKPNEIAENSPNSENKLDGFPGNRCFIPIVKGGNVKYLKDDSWFMNWSNDALKNYKTNKKTRLQNTKFYFKYGIGVPMISSSSITAALIENKLFDQSIVGIFPKDEALTYYLLAFFNSPTCNKIIRTINPSANNPSNYIKKIPFIAPSVKQKAIIDNVITTIIDQIKSSGTYVIDYQDIVNNAIEEIYGF